MRAKLIASTLFLACALAAACASGNQRAANAAGDSAMASASPAANAAQVEQALLQFERESATAMGRNDIPWAEKNIPDDFIYTASDGQMMTKAELLGAIKSGDLKYESATVDEMKVHVYGDAAVVTGKLTSRAKFKGQEIGGTERWTDTFIKRNGRWEPVATHNSMVVKH
jgi:hypothetical protein